MVRVIYSRSLALNLIVNYIGLKTLQLVELDRLGQVRLS